MAKGDGVVKRIDKDLAEMIEKFAKKNDLKFRQASKEIAKFGKVKFDGKKVVREIKF